MTKKERANALKRARAFRDELLIAFKNPDNNWYTYGLLKKKNCRSFINAGCYGQLQSHVTDPDNPNLFFIDTTPVKWSHNLHKPNKAAVEKYVKWWVNNSFVAKCIVTKNVNTILTKGVIFDCAFPAPLVGIAAMGLRYVHERSDDLIPTWAQLVDMGINPNTAIFCAHSFRRVADDRLDPNSHLMSGHSWLQTCVNHEAFKMVMNNKLEPLTTTMETSTKYSPLSIVFKVNKTIGDNTILFRKPEPDMSGQVKSTFGTIILKGRPFYLISKALRWAKEFEEMNLAE